MLSIYCIQEDKTIKKRFFPSCVFGELQNGTVNTFGRCSPLNTIFKHNPSAIKKFISGNFEIKFNVHFHTLEMMRDIHYNEFNKNMLEYYLGNRERVNREFKLMGNFGLYKWRKYLHQKYKKFINIIKSNEKLNLNEFSPKEFDLYNNIFDGCFNWNYLFVNHYSNELFPFASQYYSKYISHDHLEFILSRVSINKHNMKEEEYKNLVKLCVFMFSCYFKKYNTFDQSIFKFFNKTLNNTMLEIMKTICMFVPIKKAFKNKDLPFNVLSYYAQYNLEQTIKYIKEHNKIDYLAKQPFLPIMLSISKKTNNIVFLEYLSDLSIKNSKNLKFLHDLINTDLFKIKMKDYYFKNKMKKFLTKNYYVLIIDPYLQQKLKSVVDTENQMLFP